MNETYYVVTDGKYFVFWNSGYWDTTEFFAPRCLLDDIDSQSTQRTFNSKRNHDDPEWVIKEAHLEIKK